MQLGKKEEKEDFRHTLLFNVLLLVIGLGVAYGIFVGVSLGYTTDAPLRVVVSGSMIPELNIGDVVLVRGVGPQIVSVLIFTVPSQGLDPSTLKIGDDIIFWYYQYSTVDPIVHKIIAINPSSSACQSGIQFTTHGVANPTGANEYPCAYNVIGLVVGKIPYVGYVSEFLRSPVGEALIIMVIVILIAVEVFEPQKDEESTEP